MKLRWSERATRDTEDIVSYIAHDSGEAAHRWLEETFEAVEKLQEFPRLGRVVPEFGVDSLRELIHGRYRIVYELGEEDITIVTVFDGSRLLI